jgi:hypothetical protein
MRRNEGSAQAMSLTAHWTDDGDDDWHLLDRLLAAVRHEYHPPDEVLCALITCLAKTIAQMDDDVQIDACVAQLRGAVEFHKELAD